MFQYKFIVHGLNIKYNLEAHKQLESGREMGG